MSAFSYILRNMLRGFLKKHMRIATFWLLCLCLSLFGQVEASGTGEVTYYTTECFPVSTGCVDKITFVVNTPGEILIGQRRRLLNRELCDIQETLHIIYQGMKKGKFSFLEKSLSSLKLMDYSLLRRIQSIGMHLRSLGKLIREILFMMLIMY